MAKSSNLFCIYAVYLAAWKWIKDENRIRAFCTPPHTHTHSHIYKHQYYHAAVGLWSLLRSQKCIYAVAGKEIGLEFSGIYTEEVIQYNEPRPERNERERERERWWRFQHESASTTNATSALFNFGTMCIEWHHTYIKVLYSTKCAVATILHVLELLFAPSMVWMPLSYGPYPSSTTMASWLQWFCERMYVWNAKRGGGGLLKSLPEKYSTQSLDLSTTFLANGNVAL